MLAAQVHIGTRNSDSQMQDYIWRRRQVMPVPFFCYFSKCVLFFSLARCTCGMVHLAWTFRNATKKRYQDAVHLFSGPCTVTGEVHT